MGYPDELLLLLLVWPAQLSRARSGGIRSPVAHDRAFSLYSFTLATPPEGVGGYGHSNTLITFLGTGVLRAWVGVVAFC